MRAKSIIIMGILGGLAAGASAQTAGWQSVQGVLRDNNDILLSGNYDLEFRIYDAPTAGSLVDMDGDETLEDPGDDVKSVTALAINQGVFNTKFGPTAAKAFDGNPRWLQISIRPTGIGAFTALTRVELVTAPASAEQVTRPASGLRAIVTDSFNQVGIGTSTPASRLHVNGLITCRDAAPGIAANAVLDFTAGYVLFRDGLAIDDTAGTRLWLATPDGGDVYFGPRAGGGAAIRSLHMMTNKFTIQQSPAGSGAFNVTGAKVGIGTANPQSTLHILNTLPAALGANITLENASDAGGSYVALYGKAGTDAANRGRIDIGKLSTQTTHGFIALNVDEGDGSGAVREVMRISGTGGRVGIGTTTPSQKLDVAGQIRSDLNIVPADPGWEWWQGPYDALGGAWQLTRRNISIGNAARAITVSPSGGWVGIGTTTPAAQLHVVNQNGGECAIRLQKTTAPEGIWHLAAESDGSFQIQNRTSVPGNFVKFTQSGNVGIGVPTPSEALDVAGNVRCTSVIQTSSRRFKRNIRPIRAALAKLLSLNGVAFDWDAAHGGSSDLGLVAEDVANVLPELVACDNSGKLSGLKYDHLSAVTVEAIREQQSQIEKLRAENDRLREELSGLGDRLAVLESTVAKSATSQEK